MNTLVEGQLTITGEEALGLRTPQQLSLLEQIEYSIDQEEGLRRQLRNAREMLESELLQNEGYAKAKEAAKLARQELKTAKMKAMQSPIARELADKVDELKADATAEKETLQLTAYHYSATTNQDTILRGEDTYKILKFAKLKKEKVERKKKRN